MKVIFLDYDGVVNNIIWDSEGKKANYGYPNQGKVNDFQACQWVSEFCEKYEYSIVVTSTWRRSDNYIECLYRGGLRPSVKVSGRIDLDLEYKYKRSELIAKYLEEHPEIDGYLIFDDEYDEGTPKNHLVLCDHDGFYYTEYHKAIQLHNTLEAKKEYSDLLYLRTDNTGAHIEQAIRFSNEKVQNKSK